MRKFLASILITLATCFGALAVTEVAPALAAVTDCSQTAAYGDRVCIDPTTPYGPLVQIFTPGGTYWNAFPFTPVNWSINADSGVSHSSWSALSPYGAVGYGNTTHGLDFVYVGNFNSATAPIAYTNNATYDAWMVWFGNGSSYPSMEFFVVL